MVVLSSVCEINSLVSIRIKESFSSFARLGVHSRCVAIGRQPDAKLTQLLYIFKLLAILINNIVRKICISIIRMLFSRMAPRLGRRNLVTSILMTRNAKREKCALAAAHVVALFGNSANNLRNHSIEPDYELGVFAHSLLKLRWLSRDFLITFKVTWNCRAFITFQIANCRNRFVSSTDMKSSADNW